MNVDEPNYLASSLVKLETAITKPSFCLLLTCVCLENRLRRGRDFFFLEMIDYYVSMH